MEENTLFGEIYLMQSYIKFELIVHLTWEDSVPRGALIDFYDGGDHVRPFSQNPKYVDQIFQIPQIC